MSREIKFRAWDKRNKDWIANGFLIMNYKGELCCCYSDKTFGEWAIDYEINFYTGLHDRHGKEIYEGDVVKGWSQKPEKPFVVKYLVSEFHCGWVATDNEECNPYLELWYRGFEVIGNIWEDRHLLEGRGG